jgi:hypothetical protein
MPGPLTGSSGFTERSRVVAAAGASAAARRGATVDYRKATAPGSGSDAAAPAADDSDPFALAERYVARVAGPSELEWARTRAREYAALRALRSDVAEFRLALLRQALDAAVDRDALAVVAAAERSLVAGNVAAFAERQRLIRGGPGGAVSRNTGNDDASADNIAGVGVARRGGSLINAGLIAYLRADACAEEIALSLPADVVAAAEARVEELKKVRQLEYAAGAAESA